VKGRKTAYFYSAGTILSTTGLAKIWSAFGNAPILLTSKPIFNVPFWEAFLVAGILEVLVAVVCFTKAPSRSVAWLLIWLGASFLVYRMGLIWVGYRRPCPCLGTLVDAIHLNPTVANMAMMISLSYIILGGIWVLATDARLE
jgi:hypothetical protein